MEAVVNAANTAMTAVRTAQMPHNPLESGCLFNASFMDLMVPSLVYEMFAQEIANIVPITFLLFT